MFRPEMQKEKQVFLLHFAHLFVPLHTNLYYIYIRTIMKKLMIALLLLCTVSVKADNVMKKEKDGTYVVNTTTLAQDVEGYNGPTPVELHIKKNKLVKVVMLKNLETPKYNARVKKQMLPAYDNTKLKKKDTNVEVDGVTGATFTSNAVKENVRRGLEYYWKHK